MLDRLKSNCICDIMKLLYISPTFSGTGGIGPHAFRVAKKLGENAFLNILWKKIETTDL